jgi:hypothetical protein
MPSRIVNMTVPEDLLAEVDEVARSEGRTRSELFRIAVRGYVRRRREAPKDSRPPLSRLARLAIFEKYADTAFSFTDCTGFAVMRRAKIRLALTLDRHFRQFGFDGVPAFPLTKR